MFLLGAIANAVQDASFPRKYDRFGRRLVDSKHLERHRFGEAPYQRLLLVETRGVCRRCMHALAIINLGRYDVAARII